MRRAVQRDPDPRLPAPLHRRGGRGRRGVRRAHARRRDRLHLSRARSRARARRRPRPDHGRDVRVPRGGQPRAGRLDAPVRRVPPLLRRQRDRGRGPARGRGARAGRLHAGPAQRHRVLLRRGRGRRGRVPRVHEPRRAVAPARAVRLREQPLRDGHRARAVGVADRHRAQGRRLRGRGVARRRHGRRRGARGGAARVRLDPRRRRAPPRRGAHVPVPRALDVRPRALPRQGGGRAVEATRPDRAVPQRLHRGGDAGRRGVRRARRRGACRRRRGGRVRRAGDARTGRGPPPVRHQRAPGTAVR
ncbi:MAG: hypothetical protein KatS3mg009_1241 [Acidimicrobiia bacterium]|nr:MAG: hypothetical protein KatS3mg009_1241 [Acidimicrobiia bacterium]